MVRASKWEERHERRMKCVWGGTVVRARRARDLHPLPGFPSSERLLSTLMQLPNRITEKRRLENPRIPIMARITTSSHASMDRVPPLRNMSGDETKKR